MVTLEATIPTERASRYLVQLGKHATAMGRGGGHRPRVHLHRSMARDDVRIHADCSDSRGTVTFTPWGRCTMTADAAGLTLRIEATDEENLLRIQGLIGRNLDRFSRRNPLTVSWRRTETPDASSDASSEAGPAA